MSRFDLKDQEDFESTRSRADILYHSLAELYCPYLKEKIFFNAKGWDHIRFKNRTRSRSPHDQYVRFKLLPLAIWVISNSHTLQGLCSTKAFESVNINSRRDNLLKQVTFWEFMAVLDEVRIKVVIKQVEGGEKHFFSVIPYWKIKPGTNERILYGHLPLNE